MFTSAAIKELSVPVIETLLYDCLLLSGQLAPRCSHLFLIVSMMSRTSKPFRWYLQSNSALIKSMCYQDVAEQVKLHRAFNLYLDSCNLIQCDSCIDQLTEDERVVTKQFSTLDSELIRESLKAKIYMLKLINEFNSYLDCLVTFVNQRRREGKSELDELLSQLKEKGFFYFSDLPSDNAAQENWEDSKLHVLIKEAKNVAFSGLPTHYVVQGLVDYSFIFSLNGEHHRIDSVEGRLEYVQEYCERKAAFLREELWLYRSYDATIYDKFGDALSVVDSYFLHAQIILRIQIDVPSIDC